MRLHGGYNVKKVVKKKLECISKHSLGRYESHDSVCYSAIVHTYSKTCLKRPIKNGQNKDLNDKCWLNECQKYYRMLPLEHSAILFTCFKG